MSNNLNIGKILEGDQGRDAIHMAVIPVKCSEPLNPGAPAVVTSGQAVWDEPEEAIGIIDPFLRNTTQPGDWVWLFIKPGTITGLRHQWYHPAFPSLISDPKQASIEWLRHIASECGVDYEEMMGCVEHDDYIHMGTNEHYKTVLDGQLDAFKKHCEVALGRELSDQPYPFSCSC